MLLALFKQNALNFCVIFIQFYAYLQITTIAAAINLRLGGRPPVLPSNKLSYTENFLYMLDSLYVFSELT
jgi:hypothetical protein